MENLTYVTGNHGKYISVKEKFEKYGIDIKFADIDINEPNINDIDIISREKARIAYEKINSPVFVIDSGFYIKNYPNNSYYPGAFVKRSGVASDINKLLNDMKNVKDRYCYFLDCLTYYDGIEYHSFYGKSEGTLGYEIKYTELNKIKSNLWYIFIPLDHSKTLAEMTDIERDNMKEGRIDPTREFAIWLKDNIMGKQKIKMDIKKWSRIS